jgi:hypothetical protein
MSNKGKSQKPKQMFKNFQNMSSKEILDDEQIKFDELYDEYEDQEQMEKINKNMRKKLKNGDY